MLGALLRVRHARSCLLGGASASNSLTAPVFLVAGRAVATEGVSTVAGPGPPARTGNAEVEIATRPRFERSAEAPSNVV